MDPLLVHALEQARELNGGPDSELLLSTLGHRLKQAGASWETGLRRLMLSMPGFCEVVGGTVRFLEGPVEGSREQSALALVPELFAAFVRDHANETAWMDMVDLTLLSVATVDGQPDEPVASDPMRYLRIPVLRTDEQISWIDGTLREIDAWTEDLAQRLGEAGHSWGKVAERELTPQQWHELKRRRQAWIVGQAVQWMERHDLPKKRLLRTTTPRPDPQVTASPSEPSELRRRAHTLVDRMTPAQLEAWLALMGG